MVVMVVEAVLFDRDGTLIEDVEYNGVPERVATRPGAAVAVDAVRAQQLLTGVVTNQSGIGRGLLSAFEVEQVNQRVDSLLGPFDVSAVCPHAPTDGCRCRKPAPGLVSDAAARLGIRTDRVVVVGDRLADLEAAQAAGAVGVLVPSEATEAQALAAADFVLASLAELPELIHTLTGEQR